jgi:hypothetical protein
MAISDVDNFDDDELRAMRSIFDGKIDVSIEVVVRSDSCDPSVIHLIEYGSL